MDDEPRKRPRPPGDRDDKAPESGAPKPKRPPQSSPKQGPGQKPPAPKQRRAPQADADTPYRLRDEPAAPPKPAAPAPLPVDEDEDDRPRPRRRPKGRRQAAPIQELMARNKGKVVGCCVLVVVAIVIGIIAVGAAVETNKELAPWKPYLSAYLATPSGKAPADVPRVVKGKMIVVDVKEKDVDLVTMHHLPPELRATKPEEVGTIVQLNSGKDPTVTYTNGMRGYVLTCKVTVIDPEQHQILWESGEFRGSAPPDATISMADEPTGDFPTDKVVAYLNGLPRQ